MYKKLKARSSKLKADEGFTLLEFMIALSIIASVIITVLVSINYNIKLVNDNTDIITAVILGREKMEEIRFFGITDKRDGDFGDDYPQLSWRLNVEDTQFKNLKRLDVRVLFGGKKELSYVSYRIIKDKG
jgi:type II secretion system protein I